MISIIFSILLIGVMIFVFVLDGDKNKLIFGNKKTSESKTNKKTQREGMHSSQNKINVEKIKAMGSGDDSALIVKDSNTYVGVLEIYGVNYNLLSINERLTLEEVFQTMINGLDYPVQFFVQSRRVDIENYKKIYNDRLDELNSRLDQERGRLDLQIERYNTEREFSDVQNNIFRLENQIEYGEQVVEFINDFAAHSNILEKRYYISIPYTYTGNIEDEDERFLTAYNTITNRANSIISALSRGDIPGKVLNGFELSELLYVSYNKKDSNKYKFDRAVQSGFHGHIVTSRPVEYKILEQKEKELKELIGT